MSTSPIWPAFEVPPPPPLGEEDGRLLVTIALHSVRGLWGPAEERLDVPPRGPVHAPAGVFVTLYRKDDLRGCLGIISSAEPVWSSVAEMAVSSATRDPRFEPIDPREYDDLAVEISVLGPLVPLPADAASRWPELIRVGEHGLLVRHRARSGLLLPQVAERYGWDALRFLEEVCYKAGLPSDSWLEKAASVSAFRCSIFKGTTHGGPAPECPD